MDVRIQTQGVKLSNSMEDYIRERVDRIEKFQSRIVDARFEMRSNRQRNGGEVFAAQFTIKLPGRLIRSEARDRDQKAAVDQATDKMKRQLRRFHSRQVDRSRVHSTNLGLLAAEQMGVFDGPPPPREAAMQTLSRTKRFELEQMSVEEAVEQMELLDHDFFLFRSSDDGLTSVVYRRRDGGYGLIIPDTESA